MKGERRVNGKDSWIIRAALVVVALPFIALGFTWLPVIGFIIGAGFIVLAVAPWGEAPYRRAVGILIGETRRESLESGGLVREDIIPVAVLTSPKGDGHAPGFDATRVDVSTVRFGPNKARPVIDSADVRSTVFQEDVDGNGYDDLILHFSAAESGITTETMNACIDGETIDGDPFRGCADLQPIPA